MSPLLTIGMSVALFIENQPPVAKAFAGACPDCPPALRGDCNCDGLVDFGDIDAFVIMLIDGRTVWMRRYKCDVQPCRPVVGEPGCYFYNADLTCDGNVDFADINAFVVALTDYGEYQATYCQHVRPRP
jgi:hypothetical protein